MPSFVFCFFYRVHSDYQKEVLTSAETQAELRLKFPTLCLPDPDPSGEFTPRTRERELVSLCVLVYLYCEVCRALSNKYRSSTNFCCKMSDQCMKLNYLKVFRI